MRNTHESGTGARVPAVAPRGVLTSVVAGAVLLGSATVLAGPASAQDAQDADAVSQAGTLRYGDWRLQSDAPPPQSNIMTYEPWGDGGMQITVRSTNSRGESSEWGYTTLFDGVFRPVEGQEGAETAVEVVDERTTRISNARNGRVYQVILNVLSDDGDTINNEYIRLDDEGKITRVSHAVYERVEGEAGSGR